MAEYTVATKDVEYIPESYGNREAAEPIEATLGYLTAAQRSQCISGRSVQGDVAVVIDYGKAVKFGLRSLRKFRVNKAAISTAEQLMELSGFDALFMELATQIWTMNAREDLRPLS